MAKLANRTSPAPSTTPPAPVTVGVPNLTAALTDTYPKAGLFAGSQQPLTSPHAPYSGTHPFTGLN